MAERKAICKIEAHKLEMSNFLIRNKHIRAIDMYDVTN